MLIHVVLVLIGEEILCVLCFAYTDYLRESSSHLVQSIGPLCTQSCHFKPLHAFAPNHASLPVPYSPYLERFELDLTSHTSLL